MERSTIVNRLRYRCGLWLLKPWLQRELAMSASRVNDMPLIAHPQSPDHESYWLGRMTAIDRVLGARL